MKIIFLALILFLTGCSMNFPKMSVEEQIRFHQNYDGANGIFRPNNFYERFYELEKK